MEDSWYDVAQICLNGHIINDCVKDRSIKNKEYCSECGSKTITNCPKCNTEIQGCRHSERGNYIHIEKSPAFCHKCGNPFPWTEAKIIAAKSLVDEIDGLNKDEIDNLKKSLDDIVRDTPQTSVAIIRFKKYAGKFGKEIAEGFKNILTDIVSEVVKKSIWG